MAIARLPVAPDQRTIAFRKIVDLIRYAPELSTINPVVVSWDDANADNTPPASRAWIRLTPKTLPIGMAGQNGYGRRLVESPIKVSIETRIPSVIWDDSMDLGGVIERILRPESDRAAFDAELEAAGISDMEWTDPIETVTDGDGMFAAMGALKLTVWVLH